MQIEPIHVRQTNKLVADYRNNESSIMQFFDYRFTNDDFIQRVSDIKSRSYKREDLAKVLYRMNKHWGAGEATFANIERLRDESSVVVVGGQQAGVLTGPLYSVNKIISIIQLAKQQEAKLQVPVIPVFWIAGEDHDFEEINHVFLPSGVHMKKWKLPQRIIQKKPVSTIAINQQDAERWLQDVFGELEETDYTKNLYRTVCSCLEQSSTYVDFFARLVFVLFKEEGLVLLDSGNTDVRRLESDYFLDIIKNQPEISSGVYKQLNKLYELDYHIALDIQSNDGHLFYHQNGERILLVRDKDGNWVGKQNQLQLTEEEMLAIAKDNPELLSNNVVTRPLMQEMLLPTLGFIGGPGEISYWSALKPAFSALNMKMPPVLQRLSFTFISNKIEKLINRYEISLEEAISAGVDHLKLRWLQTRQSVPIQEMADELKKSVDKLHEPLRMAAKDIRSDLGALAEKNLFYIQRDIDFLKKRIEKATEEIFANQIREFDLINQVIYPLGGLQERTWNPLPWLNKYGMEMLTELPHQECSLADGHYVVKL
ncbi:bacillithiol biosynthesis cysteine-adding enzyme BshC [Virgibacillus sp. 179-BFC.A HS]|uniref:Putative cysteine ligase BshC n=1 Tax=Tigheibacillus jepli TaxID=3035914 RepID=A0ABU5CJ56_9BACI|nr:bacillithiol biosynthesis cysteine-adding enzyme BshC [Virgibacillus sp. 179-BFC.A HS]MDY0405971.1 bacillithiol biosynthesis cysteine-adding enzyme BshC [Virgibacillus sp. 179-BFC.A HS]